MFDALKHLLDTGSFMPHGICYLWNAWVMRLHLFSDLAIGLAYVAISVTLVLFVRRARREIPFSWMFLGFGTFIIACGATHFMEVWTLWVPVYWLSGALKLVTAGASILVAILLPPLLPKSLALIESAKISQQRGSDLELAVQTLKAEVAERQIAEEKIRQLNADLEERVRLRGAELDQVNRDLARMAEAINDSKEATKTTNLDGCITGWNPAAEQLYGYRREEILGQPSSILAPADLLAENERLTERVKSGERIHSFETTRRRKNGEQFFVSLSLSPIQSSKGDVLGVSVVARDITERYHAEMMFRIAVEAAPNAMVMVDSRGVIVMVNAQVEKLFGYARVELIGRSVDMLVPERYRSGHAVLREGFLERPQTRPMGGGRDLHGVRKDGSEFLIEIGLNPI